MQMPDRNSKPAGRHRRQSAAGRPLRHGPAAGVMMFCLLMFAATSGLAAPEAETGREAPGWWDESKRSTNEFLDDSRVSAEKLWEESRAKAAELWRRSLEVFRSDGGDSAFSEVWSEITPTLEALTLLERERSELPDSAWIARDKRANQEDMNVLLDEAVGILSLSEANPIRARIRALEVKIREARDRIADYRQAMVNAPIKSTWKTTIDDYRSKITDQQAAIQLYEAEIEEQKRDFGMALAASGVRLSADQLDLLLTSVVGDDIIQSAIVYANVKRISEQLMKLTIETGEDLAVSKRYYGMHTILLKILLHMQQNSISQIDQRYLPAIERILSEVDEISANSRRLLKEQTDPSYRQHLLANLEAQKLTAKTATLYREHLLAQRASIQQARERTGADLKVARNTYRTVMVSGELINLLRAGQKSFDQMLAIQPPRLLVFENKRMKQEFAALSARLSGSEE